MQMNFRAYRYADFSELKSMIYALYSEDPDKESITDAKISKTIKELRINPIKGRIIIFEKDKVTIGYSILIFYWSDEYGGDILHIDELYVKPEHRQRGIATSFFKHISRTFKDKIVAVQLEVTPSNSKAMNYYRKLGFEKTVSTHLIRKR
jgi:ribosomal protein S18 acetylase RimI-like enzyme